MRCSAKLGLRHGGLLLVALGAAACGGPATAPAERSGATSSAVVACASGATLEGIDVSEFQGGIDWGAVQASGRAFAIARVSDGTQHPDPTFATNWAGIKAAGMVRGVYQFFRASEDPVAQADLLLNAVGTFGPGDLPPVLDVEVMDGVSGDTLVSGVGAWAAHIQAQTGITPMVYTAPGFWDPLPNTGSLGGLVLWVANWQVNCPDTPTPWSGWTFWQYADNGSVPGIGGAVDLDQFNGTLAQLQAAAAGGDKAPQGWLDSANCTQIAGWTYDSDTAGQAINVDLYFDGPAGSGSAGVRWTADVHRPDLCTAIGSCDHGYVMPTPLGLMNGAAHQVFPYGIDSSGNGDNPLLQGAPKSFTCPAPKIPYAPAIKRHVPDPTVFAAWKFSFLTDVANLPDSELDPVPQGSDTPAAPTLVQADDGTPEVWILDGASRRHVPDPAAMTAWHFDWSSIAKTPASQVYAHPQGLDWPESPFLAKGSGPAVYVLDVTTPSPPRGGSADGGGGVGDGGPGSVLGGGPSPGGGGATGGPAGATPADGTNAGSGGGCSVTHGGSYGDAGTAWIVLGLASLRRRRTRARRGGGDAPAQGALP